MPVKQVIKVVPRSFRPFGLKGLFYFSSFLYILGGLKMENVLDVLQERGFIEQLTHEDEIRELLGKEKKMCIRDSHI